jgi:hypothetical protein
MNRIDGYYRKGYAAFEYNACLGGSPNGSFYSTGAINALKRYFYFAFLAVAKYHGHIQHPVSVFSVGLGKQHISWV